MANGRPRLEEVRPQASWSGLSRGSEDLLNGSFAVHLNRTFFKGGE